MSRRPLPDFDPRTIPFSRRGSWLNLSPVVALHTTAEDVHLVDHRGGMHAVLALVPEASGVRAETEWEATPAMLRWTHADGGGIEAVFESDDAVRLRGAGLGIRITATAAELTPFSGEYLTAELGRDSAQISSYETGARYRIEAIEGNATIAGAGALGEAARAVVLAPTSSWEVRITRSTSGRRTPVTGSFDDAVDAIEQEFDEYRSLVSSEALAAGDLASYVLWSATVGAEGFVGREAVLMSKHWMDKVWSWDHCFNALALAPADTDAAVGQFLLPFDHQDADGALPDSVTHSEVLYNFVKPPIHGWALDRLRESARRELSRGELAEIHGRLARWSDFWLTVRRAPGDALPHYLHGNDSGWDNSTVFDHDRVVKSPDLAAFLLLQLRVLADLSDELGVPSDEWHAAADEVRSALLGELRVGDDLVARSVADGTASESSSLLTCLPIVAARELPPEVVRRLVDRIETHLTDWGPATEPVASERYESDGYWRGPIWAPSTALVEDGLRSAGEHDLAATIRRRFLALCEAHGFAENFDAVTGQGLRDRAYTWTAAVYLSFGALESRPATPATPATSSL